MRVCLTALLLPLVWTLGVYLTTHSSAAETDQPTSLGLAVMGVSTLAAYAWDKRARAARRQNATLQSAGPLPLPVRYADAVAAAVQETEMEAAEHAA